MNKCLPPINYNGPVCPSGRALLGVYAPSRNAKLFYDSAELQLQISHSLSVCRSQAQTMTGDDVFDG